MFSKSAIWTEQNHFVLTIDCVGVMSHTVFDILKTHAGYSTT